MVSGRGREADLGDSSLEARDVDGVGHVVHGKRGDEAAHAVRQITLPRDLRPLLRVEYRERVHLDPKHSGEACHKRLGEQPAHAIADGDERLPRRIDGGPVRRGTRQRVEGSSRSDRARGRLRGGGALGQSRRDGQADGARAGRLHSGAQRVVRSQRIEPELDVLDAQPVQPRLDCQRAAAA